MHDSFEIEMGEKLARIRKQLGYTQKKAATEAGLSVHTLSRIENGITDISLYHFYRLCSLYGLSADQVLNLGADLNIAVAHTVNGHHMSTETIWGMNKGRNFDSYDRIVSDKNTERSSDQYLTNEKKVTIEQKVNSLTEEPEDASKASDTKKAMECIGTSESREREQIIKQLDAISIEEQHMISLLIGTYLSNRTL